MERVFKSIKKTFSLIIRVYQWGIKPWLATDCRYQPTCSNYALQCFECLPLHLALVLTARRVLSCNPWGRGGYDPVPSSTKGNHT